MCQPAHPDGAQLEVLPGVIVHYGHKVIAQVPFLVAAMLVPVLGGHQGGDVEDGCDAKQGLSWALGIFPHLAPQPSRQSLPFLGPHPA